MRTSLLVMLLLAFLARPLSADEKLKDIACRSIHLNYPGKDAVSFYNEVAIDHSAPGTYFCVCGWDKGYFGLQELGNGKKLLIFSVWDSSSDDPKALAPAKRVGLLHKDDKVRIGRFGGEGSGGQSFFDYDWKAGETYRLMVRARIDGERTEYEGWFYVPEDKAWKHLVTFSTITGGKNMGGFYSFIEDFKRDRASFAKPRHARFGNGWEQSHTGAWTPLVSARFTGDRNPATNIDAGIEKDRYFLKTGGDTKNEGTKLKGTLELQAMKRVYPDDLPKRVEGVKK